MDFLHFMVISFVSKYSNNWCMMKRTINKTLHSYQAVFVDKNLLTADIFNRFSEIQGFLNSYPKKIAFV